MKRIYIRLEEKLRVCTLIQSEAICGLEWREEKRVHIDVENANTN